MDRAELMANKLWMKTVRASVLMAEQMGKERVAIKCADMRTILQIFDGLVVEVEEKERAVGHG